MPEINVIGDQSEDRVERLLRESDNNKVLDAILNPAQDVPCARQRRRIVGFTRIPDLDWNGEASFIDFGKSNTLAAVCADGLRVFTLQYDPPRLSSELVHSNLGYIGDIAFSSDGRIAVAARDSLSDSIYFIHIGTLSDDGYSGDYLGERAHVRAITFYDNKLYIGDTTGIHYVDTMQKILSINVRTMDINGRYIAVQRDSDILIISMKDMTHEIRIPHPNTSHTKIALSPCGNHLAVSDPLEVYYLDHKNKRGILLPSPFIPCISIAFSPCGKYLATGRREKLEILEALYE